MVANTNGRLIKEMNEIITPYDVNKIVRDTKYFNFDTVTVALELYKKLGLIYSDENGCLTIANYDDMIGSETSSAKRVREHRERKKALHCNKNVTQDIEYRDKSIEIEKDKRNASEPVYSSENNISVNNEDLEKYIGGNYE